MSGEPIALIQAMNTGAINPVSTNPVGAASSAPAAGKDFRSILVESLDEVNRLQGEAEKGVQQLLTGESQNVAEVLTAVNKAGIAFDLLIEIRNKLTDAYKEIEQMQV